MFENLDAYNKILVTGPARSGTHICSKMIAADTGHRFIPENAFNAHNIRQFSRLYMHNNKFVMPCNGIISCIAEFGREDTMIICMMRSVGDILLSGWRIRGKLSGMSYLDAWTLVTERYRTWREQKVKGITNWLEVEYYSLEAHPLWVPKEERLNFRPTQTQVREVVDLPKEMKKVNLPIRKRGRRGSTLAQMGVRR